MFLLYSSQSWPDFTAVYLFMRAAAGATALPVTSVLCVGITSAIQQKVDSIILLPKAIGPYPSLPGKPLNHL